MVEDDKLLGLLKPDEIAGIEKVASNFTSESLEKALSGLARREAELLRDPRFADDPDMRELTLLNIAALVAAATMADDNLIPDQTGMPDNESAPDGFVPPRPPE